MSTLAVLLKEQARALGFDLVGIAPATPADGFARLHVWLERGFAGEMAYMHRHAEACRHPASVLPEVRSVVMVGMNYRPAAECISKEADAKTLSEKPLAPSPPIPLLRSEGEERNASSPALLEESGGAARTDANSQVVGRVARYAWGADYHDVLRQRLTALLAWVQQQMPSCRGRGVVDTAPLLERDFARRAGLGWFGKNTMLLNTRLGSYFFLGALLLDLALPPDPPQERRHCGTCTACLDACPTAAFPEPGVLDARRCLSYLTIELRSPIPREFRQALGGWVFGCDICQEVCPWNRKAPAGAEPALSPRSDLQALDLLELLGLSEEAFRQRFRGTALLRTKRRGLLRNAALVLGNRGDPAALPALQRALEDPEPLIREAAQWAIAQITPGPLPKG